MKIVIDTGRYKVRQGYADQIYLPNGKYAYVPVASYLSQRAKALNWTVETVQFYGACLDTSINSRAHRGYPIQINEVSVADFLDKIATTEKSLKELFSSSSSSSCSH